MTKFKENTAKIKSNFFSETLFPKLIMSMGIALFLFKITMITMILLFASIWVGVSMLHNKADESKKREDDGRLWKKESRFAKSSRNKFHHMMDMLETIRDNSEKIIGVTCGTISGYDYICKNIMNLEQYCFKNENHVVFIEYDSEKMIVNHMCKIPYEEAMVSDNYFRVNISEISKYYITKNEYETFFSKIKENKSGSMDKMFNFFIEK